MVKISKKDNTDKNLDSIKTMSMVSSGIIIVLLIVVAVQLGTISVTLRGMDGLAPAGGAEEQRAAADGGTNQGAPTQPTPTQPTPTVDMAALIDDDAVKGDPNAPVTIIEWSDFECPFCARFYQQTLQEIDEKYIKTGKVKLVFRDFPLSFHPNAQKSAEAAECAGDQDKFWEMHDLLFETGVKGGVDSYKQMAVDLGLDADEFNDCLDSGKHAAEVQKDMRDGSGAGIRGTPGFLVNGQVVSGAQPFANFERIIEAELAKN